MASCLGGGDTLALQMSARINQRGIRIIKHFESLRLEPYYCPAGILTVGYGHVIRNPSENKKIGPDEADELLYQDLVIAESAVSRLIKVPLNEDQFSALVSFTFNVGGGTLQRSGLRAKLNRGEYESVAPELQKWVRSGARVLAGLVLRRQLEAKLFNGLPTGV